MCYTLSHNGRKSATDGANPSETANEFGKYLGHALRRGGFGCFYTKAFTAQFAAQYIYHGAFQS